MAVNSLEKEKTERREYCHEEHEPVRRFLRFLLRAIGFTLIAKIDHAEGIENVPASGPCILMINHIAFIDPFVVLHILPRNIVPLAKIEVYNYPIVGIFPRLWQVIPVHREEIDRRAVQQVLDVLRAGEIVLVAPEGTRGPALKQGKEGVAYLAGKAQVPVVPVAISGTTGFPSLRFFSKAWRTPGAVARFGKPFRYKAAYARPSRDDLRKMTDEAMFVLSSMLPPEQRGVYADLSQATQDTIEWV